MTPCSTLPLKSRDACVKRRGLNAVFRVCASVVTAAGLMLGCSPKATTFHSMDVTGAPWGQGFSLPDTQGRVVSSGDFPGRLAVVFFGFMYCPDACPTHLTKMARVKTLMGTQADKVQLIFITLDPERDLPEKLNKYLASFDSGIIGLRGSTQQIEAVAKDFRVFFKKVDTKASASDPMAYTIDHTTFAYVFDGKGKLRLVMPHDLAEDKIASDLQNLLSR